ncbi:Rad4-domain-containing protein [Pseudovirgaria hyperparasitica]|uniref:Rad4-domain-containing protein n=1 Tax=Pseudovirgaria hyperparasitica TaxID=470096 RepID=A0A6A6WC79_9PEZI|nr:Rad4-domain-containing protein [Pseudovirgaria hyperparasitica]KAF2760313.1 Rad4-domain-containing protein [Pseudovirgaria hyperparasitica]
MAPGRPMKGNAKRARSIARHLKRPRNEDVPDVYQGLLEEASMSSTSQASLESDRPLKKRRFTKKKASNFATPTLLKSQQLDDLMSPATHIKDNSDLHVDGRRLQTVLDDYSDSNDSDMEWEDVDLHPQAQSDEGAQNEEPNVVDISIVLGAEQNALERRRPKRKGITAAERSLRLDIHKMHVSCLIYHAYLRNSWCNDCEAQAVLKALIPPKIVTLLLPDPEWPQMRMSQSFREGLNTLKIFWNSTFRINAQGMYRPRWYTSGQDTQPVISSQSGDPPMDRGLFRDAALRLNGSQDIGAQLLCTLLRAIGVEARLVCSLQCLPITAGLPQTAASSPLNGKETVYLDTATDIKRPSQEDQELQPTPNKSLSTSTPIKRISRIGRPTQAATTIDKGKAPKITAIPKSKPLVKPHYPVFWVEAFDAAHQRWISVDPLATFTLDKPMRLEPPLQSHSNVMTYVIAYEEDGTARDVTRRYAKAYNAKTRKTRVENTDGGIDWLRQVMKPFKRSKPLDRDQLEDAALARQEAAEGLPKNIQDFKDHPVYVLERHLRRNEVLYPKNEVGKVNVGSALSKKIESVFRRTNVHVVRSADKWYRLGREVIPGEQPLKHALPRPKGGMARDENDSDDNPISEIGLYAAYQTKLYVPPPVVRGRIPKNTFGNLDIYTPTMVPPGGIHILHADASKAARIVGVDYADAVTGFSFHGRVGTAVIQGCVIAAEYREAVETVIDGLAYAQEKVEMSKRVSHALYLWRRFHLGLKIVERVKAYASDEEHVDVQAQIDVTELQQAAHDATEARYVEAYEGGGFFPGEAGDEEMALPTSHRASSRLIDNHEDNIEEEAANDNVLNDEDEDIGGGFLPDEIQHDSGGFFPDVNVTYDGGSILKESESGPARMHLTSRMEEPVRSHEHSTNDSLRSHTQYTDPKPSKPDEHAADASVTSTLPLQDNSALQPEKTGNPMADQVLTDQTQTGKDTLMSGALDISYLHFGPNVTLCRENNTEELGPERSDLHSPEAKEYEDSGSTTFPRSNPKEEHMPVSSPPDSDQGSLLSHDPEDEDAEPEWLY